MKDLIVRINDLIDSGNQVLPAGKSQLESAVEYGNKATELLAQSADEIQELRRRVYVDTSGVTVGVQDLLLKHVEDPVPGTPGPVRSLLRRLHEELSRPTPIKEVTEFTGTHSGGTYYTFQVDGHLGDDETLLNRLLDGVLNMGNLRVQDKVSVLRYWIDRLNRKSTQDQTDYGDPF